VRVNIGGKFTGNKQEPFEKYPPGDEKIIEKKKVIATWLSPSSINTNYP
jgi:hypothetical protein